MGLLRWNFMKRRILIFSAFSIAVTAGLCQLPGLPKPKLPVNIPAIPGLDRLIKEEPPITTSLADALTEIPYLDGYDPKNQVRLTVMPRDAEGRFSVFPGDFTYEAQSYCLHAGTHGPGKGEGYLYAPLKGPKQNIIRSILRNSTRHHGLEQSKVQSLIWAILARTKPGQLAPDMRATAEKLLSPQEIQSLEGSGWDYIKEHSSGASPFGSLPGPVRQVMEAENKLRSMFYQANAPFEELERVAVLSGDYQPRRGDRNVPKGRWSYHPEGYFVRYFPNGYSHTTQTLHFPAKFTIEQDEQGAVKLISDSGGRTLKREGAELIFADPKAELARATFVSDRRASDRRRAEFEGLLKRLRGDEAQAKKLAAIADIAASFEGAADTGKEEARDFALHAWMASFDQAVRPAGSELLAAIGDFAFDGRQYDPSGTVATPGETGRQRLAQSARCKEESSNYDSGEAGEFQKAVVNAMRANGFPATGPENVYVYDQRGQDGLLRFVVRMRDGKPLPTKDCIDEAIAGGHVPPGSLETANELLFGSVQFAGSQQRTAIRTVRVETGEITGFGKGDGPNFPTSSDNAFKGFERYR
jgi:hypothetical protein